MRDYKAFLLTRLSPNTIGSHMRDAFFKVIQYFSVFFAAADGSYGSMDPVEYPQN